MTTTLQPGTVVFSNGSGTVVGTGTFFTALPNTAMIRKHVGTGVPEPIYFKTGHTDDTHMTIEPPYAGASSSPFDQYDAVVFQSGTLADFVQLTSFLISRFGSMVSLTAGDTTLTLNRDATSDDAGFTWTVDDVETFRWGQFGDGSMVLARKSGVSWVPVLTVASSGTVTFAAGAITSSLQPRNRAFNGAMRLSSVNGTSTVDVNATTTEIVDGFSVQTSGGGVIRAQQDAGPSLGGSSNVLKLTVQTIDASVAAGDIYRAPVMTIKGRDIADLKWGTASAQPLTLQFSINAGLAGTRCVSVRNAAGTRSLVKEYTVAAGEVGVNTLHTVTFAGDTGGSWLNTDADALVITWDWGSGANFNTTADVWAAGNYTRTTNQSSVIGNASIVDKLSDVAWYVGSTAPTYEVPRWTDELIRSAVDYNTDQATLAFKEPISIAGIQTITAQSATAQTVGRQGATSPAWTVDSSNAAGVTGWKALAAALAAGAFLAVTSIGANEGGFIDAKGSGALTLQSVATGNVVVGANKVTIVPASGNTTIAGTLGVTGDFAVNTNKFTVAASSGNTVVAGTLGVTGVLTASISVISPLGVFGGATNDSTGAVQARGVDNGTSGVFIGRSLSQAITFVVRANGAVECSTGTFSGAITYGGVTLSNAVTGTGNMVLSASPTLTGTLTGATATFSGVVTHSSTTTLSGALTYGGVTLSNAVTGTGNMVLSASPTLTGTTTIATLALTTVGAHTISGAITYGGVTLSNAVTGTGNMVLSASPTFTGTLTAGFVDSIGASCGYGLAARSGGHTINLLNNGGELIVYDLTAAATLMQMTSTVFSVFPSTASTSPSSGCAVFVGGLGVGGTVHANKIAINCNSTGNAVEVKGATGAGSSYGMWVGFNESGTLTSVIRASGGFESATNSYGSTSDRRLKSQIADATPKLEKFMRVRHRTFMMKGVDEMQMGVIADEIADIFPSLVYRPDDGFDRVKYSILHGPILAKAFQEFVTETRAGIAALEARVH